MSKFAFHSSVPREARTAVEAHLSPLEWMVPRWCERVNVLWQIGEDDGCSMQTVVNFEYRFAELFIRPCWLECVEEMRRDSVIHELIHLHVNPLYNYADRTIKVLTDGDDKAQTLFLEEARRYVEGVTQDLTDAVFRRLTEVPQRKTK